MDLVPDPHGSASHALATVIQLARRSREAQDSAELNFIAVNETHGLAPYRQAVLWSNRNAVVALSGVVSPESNAPYVHWLTKVMGTLQSQNDGGDAARVVTAADLSAAEAAEWGDWLPANALWLRLPRVDDRYAGGALLLAREEVWDETEHTLLVEWANIWAHAQALHSRRSGWNRIWRLGSTSNHGPQADGAPVSAPSRLRRLLLDRRAWAALAAIAVMLIPVQLTVLAPAELVARDPAVIRAPLDGVVGRVLVTPNQRVQINEPLFEFDRASIQNRLEVSMRTLDTAQAEYRQRAQQALFDPASKSQLALLQGRIAEKSAEVDYLRTLSERGVVLSPRAGIVLFDDPTNWVGRPTVTGERVMMVADERLVEVEAWLSPSDAIRLVDGSDVVLYMNADPLQPVRASLRYVGHQAIERPDGTYAYRVRATVSENTTNARVGLKGTAKLEGSRVSLAYWIVRRPLAAARVWLGV